MLFMFVRRLCCILPSLHVTQERHGTENLTEKFHTFHIDRF